MKKVYSHFQKNDPILFKVLKDIGLPEKIEPKKPSEFFIGLCNSIANQQLSGKAAATIFQRFEDLFSKEINPKDLLKIPDEKLREVGFSWQKVKYLKDLSLKVESGEVVLENLPKLESEEVIKELTKIKGIGVWTAEMFLMFSLGREDIFSHGDLGLKRGIEKIYQVSDPDQDFVQKLSEKWSPYRTWASRILWKSLNNR